MPLRLTDKDLARLNRKVLDRAKSNSKQPPPIKTAGKLKPSIRSTDLRDELDKQTSETALSKTITDDAETVRKLFVIRLQAGGIPIDYKVKSGEIRRRYIKFCKKGTPDKLLLPGVPLFLEVKKKGEKTRSDQLKVHAEIKASGALVFTVDTFDDYALILDALDDQKQIVEKIRELIVSLQLTIENQLNKRK